MSRKSEAEVLREALEEPEQLEEEREHDPSSATPLQVLEQIAVSGKSETARVQALKVLLDRQHQLENERQQGNGLSEKCPVCLDQEKQWRPNGELAAETLEILFDLGVLVPGLLREAITSAEAATGLVLGSEKRF
jgi:hypothetical protein